MKLVVRKSISNLSHRKTMQSRVRSSRFTNQQVRRELQLSVTGVVNTLIRRATLLTVQKNFSVQTTQTYNRFRLSSKLSGFPSTIEAGWYCFRHELAHGGAAEALLLVSLAKSTTLFSTVSTKTWSSTTTQLKRLLKNTNQKWSLRVSLLTHKLSTGHVSAKSLTKLAHTF